MKNPLDKVHPTAGCTKKTVIGSLSGEPDRNLIRFPDISRCGQNRVDFDRGGG